MSKPLAPEEIDAALAVVPGWVHAGSVITRTYLWPTYSAGLAFAVAVGHLAELAQHHPDILIQYRRVRITLSTHEASGLTELDFTLAAEIDRIAGTPVRIA